jgi:hypothetical protein
MPDTNESQTRFLYAAILDTCAIIRAIDTKVAAVFVSLALPFTKLSAIWEVAENCLGQTYGLLTTIVPIVICIFALSWGAGFAAALRTFLHVDNPAEHISGERPPGRFYNADLFRLSAWSIFFSPRTDSTLQFNAFFAQLPASDEACRKELAYELMKLVYIRSVKMKRAYMTYSAFWTWIVSGGCLWTYHLATRL